jgi:uncharacterized membrane protein YbhN (UPF0104 family)
VLWPIAIGIAIFVVVALLADVGKVREALARFDWRLLPLAVVLTLGNYSIRWLRWHLYLRMFGITVPPRESVAVFLGGLGMAITPGKLGEFVKAFLLQQQGRATYAVVVPIVVAERMADALSMMLLALVGIAGLGRGPVAILLPAVPVVALIVLVRWRGLAEWLLDRATHLPFVGRIAARGRGYYESTYALFGPGTLLMAIGMGAVAWFSEALALLVILGGLGVPQNDALILQATGAMAIATIIGGISFLPGGLGFAEGGLLGLLTLFVPGITVPQAAAATMLFRLVTFWFGVSLGVVTLAWLLRRIGRGSATSAA